jgi:hypothetical protein
MSERLEEAARTIRAMRVRGVRPQAVSGTALPPYSRNHLIYVRLLTPTPVIPTSGRVAS